MHENDSFKRRALLVVQAILAQAIPGSSYHGDVLLAAHAGAKKTRGMNIISLNAGKKEGQRAESPCFR
jgi:hypothetical protein